MNHGTDLALRLDSWGQDWVGACPEEPLLRKRGSLQDHRAGGFYFKWLPSACEAFL